MEEIVQSVSSRRLKKLFRPVEDISFECEFKGLGEAN